MTDEPDKCLWKYLHLPKVGRGFVTKGPPDLTSAEFIKIKEWAEKMARGGRTE